MKRTLSLILALALSVGTIPASASENNAETGIPADIMLEEEDTDGGGAATPVPIAEIEAEDIQAVYPEPDDEPIVHTETVDNMFGFPEQDEDLMPQWIPGENDADMLSMDSSNEKLWQSLYTDMFGDDYLSAYSSKSGQRVTGNTNRLVIEETDLRLPGKNGLDVVIKRKYDNQDYNMVYNYVNRGPYAGVTANQNRYVYAFKNTSSNETVNIGFLSEDQMHMTMYNGCRITSLEYKKPESVEKNGETITYYCYEDIEGSITDDEAYDRYEYDSSVKVNIVQKKYTQERYAVYDRRLLKNNGYLVNDWNLILPEAYMYRYEESSETSRYPHYYNEEYVGAFRDIEGNIYTFNNVVSFTKNEGENSLSKYSSSIKVDNGGGVRITSYYNPQTLYEDGPEYNFVAEDSRGLKYYMYNDGFERGIQPSQKQNVYIVAVMDIYGNMIRYEYDSQHRAVTKIIDTYGREININGISGGAEISYYDPSDGENKSITYKSEKLPASALNNDSPLKMKDVYRLTVTNQEGEKTIYDSREADSICCYFFSNQAKDYDLFGAPDPMYWEVNVQQRKNIERIIYPTGAETRYRYKYINKINNQAKVQNGVYAVESSYDIVDGKTENKTEYSFTNTKEAMTIAADNSSADYRITDSYNDDGLLINSRKTKCGSMYGSGEEVEYRYDQWSDPSEAEISGNGKRYTMKYTYRGRGTAPLSSISDGRYRIDYTYHYRPYTDQSGIQRNASTDMIASVTYTDLTGEKEAEDYKITTTLTADNKSIEYERTEQGGIIKAQKKYEYDSEGSVTAVKQWTNDTNSDGVLDENDDIIELNCAYTLSHQKLLTVSDTVPNVLNADGENEGAVTSEYGYNIYGSPISKKDPYGIVTTVEYDSLNRPVKYIAANGGTRQITYNAARRYTLVKDEAGVTMRYETDGLGRDKAKYIKDGSTYRKLREYTYDAAGRIASKTSLRSSSDGVKEEYKYDFFGRLTEKSVYSLPGTLLYTESYAYNDKVTTVTTAAADGAEAAQRVNTADNYGRLISSESIAGDTVIANKYEYDYIGRLIKETAPKGGETSYEYGWDGQITNQMNAAGGSVSTVYDLAGQAVSVIDAMGNTTNTTYDKLGRAVKVVSPFDSRNSAETKTYYDRNSNVVKKAVKQQGAKYLIEEYKYDAVGNRIAVIANDGKKDHVTQYEYDAANRVTKMITGLPEYSENPEGGAVTQYSYNYLGRLYSVTDPLGQTERYLSYDYAGNLLTMKDRSNNSRKNVYGAFGLTKTYFDGTSEAKEYTYDSIGRITAARSVNKDGSEVSESYSYDPFGRVKSKTSNGGYVQKYGYDENSNITSYRLMKDEEVKDLAIYLYDSMNRLVRLTNNGTMAIYDYDANSRLINKYITSGVTTEYEYNNAGMMTSMETRGSKVYTYARCNYYLDGLLSSVTVPYGENNSQMIKQYVYDNMGRLTYETTHTSFAFPYMYMYEYDLRGNRTKTRIDADYSQTCGEVYYTYDLNNRLLSENAEMISGMDSTVTEHSYDANGNMTAKQTYLKSGDIENPVSAEMYSYDAFNRMTGFSSGSTGAAYTYNADNLRTGKTVNGVAKEFIWNGQNIAAEVSGESVSAYIYDNTGLHIANHDGTITSYIKDHHRSIVGTADFNGEMVQEGNGIVYKAFGGLWEGETPDNFGYCGEYFDDESGLVYLRNRYYDPETGRFITEDPAKDGVNWYTYAGNDPVNFIDPWGLKAGDAFSSINEALADAYWCYYGVTAFTQLEQGAAVYQYSDIDEATGTVTAKYSYTAPVIDEPHQVKLEGCVNDIPEGGSLFGFWHTHPGYTDDMNKFAESFSDTDKGFINKYDTTTPFGLFTPQGNINVLLSQGEKFNIPNPNARPLYQTVLTDRDFKKLIPAEKLLLSLRYGNAYYEFLQTNAELVKQYPWYADNEAIENLEIVQIYKDPQKYIDFLVGK